MSLLSETFQCLSLGLIIAFMDGVRFLLFVDFVVLLTLLNSDLKLAPGEFAAKCEAAKMSPKV